MISGNDITENLKEEIRKKLKTKFPFSYLYFW
jgi:hypothetical protein